MKVAIVYYSLEGNSRLVAERLATLLHADVCEIESVRPYPTKGPGKFIAGGRAAASSEKPELKPYSFDEGDYDLVVLAGPVWANHVASPLNTFLAGHDLSGCKVALAICSMGGNASRCAADFTRKLGLSEQPPTLSLRSPAAGKEPDLDGKLAAFAKELTR